MRKKSVTHNLARYSTTPDTARFFKMLLNGDTPDGRRYLSAASRKFLFLLRTGNPSADIFLNETYGNRDPNHGWGIATCVLRTPHETCDGNAIAR